MSRNGLPAGYVKLRGIGEVDRAGNCRSGGLTVPVEMMKVLSLGMIFKAEFTPEGILFRFVTEPAPEELVDKPDWAK